jgi:hypothetical protein
MYFFIFENGRFGFTLHAILPCPAHPDTDDLVTTLDEQTKVLSKSKRRQRALLRQTAFSQPLVLNRRWAKRPMAR